MIQSVKKYAMIDSFCRLPENSSEFVNCPSESLIWYYLTGDFSQFTNLLILYIDWNIYIYIYICCRRNSFPGEMLFAYFGIVK